MDNKPFDEELKAKYDKLGKQYAIEIAKDIFGAKVVRENIKEDHADFSDGFWDLEFEKAGKKFKVEPEIKVGHWDEQYAEFLNRPFEYRTMDIPFRKNKNIADYHMVIDDNGKYGFVVARSEMNKCKVITKRTIYEPNGGPYFSIPVSLGFFVEKVNGLWQRWEPK